MVLVAQAIRNCVGIPYSSWSEFEQSDFYQSGQFPEPFTEVYRAAFDQVGPSCAYVNAQRPDGQGDHFTWSNHWYRRAASAGNPIAQLEMSFQRLPFEPESRETIAGLLNTAYDLDDYRIYYYAVRLYASGRHDDRGMTGRMWQYLGCLKHAQCSAAGLRADLEVEYVPADVEVIVETASRISDVHPSIDFVAEPTLWELADF